MNMIIYSNLAASPKCGKRLLPGLVDEIAITDPERTFVLIPKTFKSEDGFMDISYRKFVKAVDNCV